MIIRTIAEMLEQLNCAIRSNDKETLQALTFYLETGFQAGKCCVARAAGDLNFDLELTSQEAESMAQLIETILPVAPLLRHNYLAVQGKGRGVGTNPEWDAELSRRGIA